tara:strand:+ start:257 stop:1048 length:792 start_codon:yes stop_codon:yes gene_type:complete
MKRIYEFTVDREETVKEETVKQEKDGTEITTSKDVKKNVPKKYFLRRPTRTMTDEAELYYGVKLAEGIKAGLLTRALLEKRFDNDGGTRNDKENEQYKETLATLEKLHKEQSKILNVQDKKRTAAQKKRLKEIEEEMKPARRTLRDIQLMEDGLYEETAESRARNKVILWWMLNLAYADKDGKEVPFFGEGTFEQKLDRYDEIDEGEDVHELVVARKIAYYVSFWFVGRPNTQKEFQEMIDMALKIDEEEAKASEEKPEKVES